MENNSGYLDVSAPPLGGENYLAFDDNQFGFNNYYETLPKAWEPYDELKQPSGSQQIFSNPLYSEGGDGNGVAPQFDVPNFNTFSRNGRQNSETGTADLTGKVESELTILLRA